MKKIILFDLDGTLLDSGEGIIKSLQYAIEKMNLPEKSEEDLKVFIGPPLLEQLMLTFKLDQETAEKMVHFYRERYSTIGIFESNPYQGIESLLEKLKEKDYLLGVASSKPEKYVKIMLEHFNLDHFFTVIAGSDFEKGKNTKAAVIKDALIRLEHSFETDKVIMIGDKEHDVEGANEVGIPCISVLYGYGLIEDIQVAAPKKIVASVNELEKELLNF